MEYVTFFSYCEAYIWVCIEADNAEEAKEQAKKLVSNEPEKVARGFSTNVANWYCDVCTYEEYARISSKLNQKLKEFQNEKVIAFNDFYNYWD